jgi:hypothetical protein
MTHSFAWFSGRPLVSTAVLTLAAATFALVTTQFFAHGQSQGLSAATPSQSAGTLRLEDGTPIKLRLQRTISSADAQVDERVDFDVLEEIKVGDVLVIPKGSVAWGTVTEAQPKRRMGRGGKLNVNIDSVRLANGEKAALRAVKETKGGGHAGAMTGAIVATSIVFFPAAPLFLFMHGKDITIPKGTEIAAYINGDNNLDPAKFGVNPPTGTAATPAAPEPTSVPPQPMAEPAVPASLASENLATVVIKCSPDGAEITVDGKYVGSPPSTLRLAPGDHVIVIEKSGYKTWQRTMSVNPGGIVTIDATLARP